MKYIKFLGYEILWMIGALGIIASFISIFYFLDNLFIIICLVVSIIFFISLCDWSYGRSRWAYPIIQQGPTTLIRVNNRRKKHKRKHIKHRRYKK